MLFLLTILSLFKLACQQACLSVTFYFIYMFVTVVPLCSDSHPEVQLICPGSDHPVLRRGPVVDLVLEDVVASRGVSVLIEDHGCAGTSCCEEGKCSRGHRRAARTRAGECLGKKNVCDKQDTKLLELS